MLIADRWHEFLQDGILWQNEIDMTRGVSGTPKTEKEEKIGIKVIREHMEIPSIWKLVHILGEEKRTNSITCERKWAQFIKADSSLAHPCKAFSLLSTDSEHIADVTLYSTQFRKVQQSHQINTWISFILQKDGATALTAVILLLTPVILLLTYFAFFSFWSPLLCINLCCQREPE